MNYVTSKCYHRVQHFASGLQARVLVINERALVINSLDSHERARPILGAQPLALGAAPMRYTISIEDVTKGSKIVLVDYYIEEEPSVDISTKNIETQ